MSKAMSYGQEDSVTLATTQTLITGVDEAAWLTIDTSDVDVYITHVSPSDGAALPASGRWYVPASAMPYSRYIGAHGAVSLAGSGAGTCQCTFELEVG